MIPKSEVKEGQMRKERGSRTRILSELLRTILAPSEGQVQLSRRQVGCPTAALEPSWGQLRQLG